MLAYAYNNMDTTTLASTSESVPGKPPQIPDDVKVKLVDKVKMTWPKTTDRKVSSMIDSLYLETELHCLGMTQAFLRFR